MTTFSDVYVIVRPLLEKLSIITAFRDVKTCRIKRFVEFLNWCVPWLRFALTSKGRINVYVRDVDLSLISEIEISGFLPYLRDGDYYVIRSGRLVTVTFRSGLPRGTVARLCREGKITCEKVQKDDGFYYLVDALSLYIYALTHVREIDRAFRISESVKKARIERETKLRERCNILVSLGVYSSLYECYEHDDVVLNDEEYEKLLKLAEESAEELRRMFEEMDVPDRLMVLCQLFSKYAKEDPYYYRYKEEIIKVLLKHYPDRLYVTYLKSGDEYYDLFEIMLRAEKKIPSLSYVIHIPVPRAKQIGIYDTLKRMVTCRSWREYAKYGSPPNGILRRAFPIDYLVQQYNILMSHIRTRN